MCIRDRFCVSCCLCGECASRSCQTSHASKPCGIPVPARVVGPRARWVAAATVGSISMAHESCSAR
eukprot:10920674-Prorocentrum_lima.AAC.1